MYLPKYFEAPNTQAILSLIDENPFATLITTAVGPPQANHLPLLLERNRGTHGTLIGHMARANPQSSQINEQEVLVIFHGPHTYITPSWYKDPLNVPTWNYAVAHIYGKARLVENTEAILTKMVQKFEGNSPNPWKFSLPKDYLQELTQSIFSFEIEITRIEGKFKLSQNRNEEDYIAVLQGLEKHPDVMSHKVLEIMRKNSRA